MPKLSIIVPVYNVQDYLVECLESIKSQSFKDWECILVDDGSTDSSGTICDRYATEDKRFIVIHQPNSGQAVARNRGLATICGQYISFIDSDDYLIGDKLYENLIKKLDEDTNLDLIQFPIQENTLSTITYSYSSITVQGMDNILNCFQNWELSTTCWNKLYRTTSIPNNVRFPKGLYFEDEWFITDLLPNLKKIMLCDIGAYGYRIRNGSTTHSNKTNKHIASSFLRLIHTAKFASQYNTLSTLYLNVYKQLLRELSYNAYREYVDSHPEYIDYAASISPNLKQLLCNIHHLSAKDVLMVFLAVIFGKYGIYAYIKIARLFSHHQAQKFGAASVQ